MDEHNNQSEFEQRFRTHMPREAHVVRRGAKYSRAINDIITPRPSRSIPEAKQSEQSAPEIVEDNPTSPVETSFSHASEHDEQKPAEKPKQGLQLPSLRGFVLATAAVAIFFVSASLGSRSINFKSTDLIGAQTLASAQQNINAKTATPQVENTSYKPTDPKNLQVDKISLTSPVSKIANVGGLSAPTNPTQISWLSNSASPTDSGKAVVLTGSASGDGSFSQLKDLQIGDKVQITNYSGQTFDFEVITTRVYAAGAIDEAKVMSPFQPGEGLNLVAFSGSGSEATVLVVFALKI